MVNTFDKQCVLEWETEGGSLGVTRVAPAETRLEPQDTAEGCMAMATADMLRAASAPDGWPRVKFEHSAVAWSRRAKLLEAAEIKRSNSW